MKDPRSSEGPSPGAARWLAAVPTIVLLVSILILGTGEMVHGQLLKLGDKFFGDPAHRIQYFMLRADPVAPTCPEHLDIDAEVARQMAQGAAKPASQDAIDAMFDSAAPSRQDPAALRASVEEEAKVCAAKHRLHEGIRSHITPSLRAFRSLEIGFLALYMLGSANRPLILLLLLAFTACHATLRHQHIGVRPPRHARDHQAQSWGMLLASGLLLFSFASFYRLSMNSGVPVDAPQVYVMWMGLFAALALASAYRLLRPLRPAGQETGSWVRALECVPLVAYMCVISGVYFFLQGHPSGPAIYANKLLDFMGLPLALALHIWAGMLFKQSRLVVLFMNVMRPWKLTPEVLSYIILLAAGLPTAYAGVSSVFVIAAGAIIYHEVRMAGASSQYALAATAMSGSLGAVLRPSLLVVGIAALNRQVTTTQLFHWGGFVFALTSTLFFIASQVSARLHQQPRAGAASPLVAVPGMLREMKSVLPYVLLIGAILLFYAEVLDTHFDENSAASILPLLMLAVLLLDRLLLRGQAVPDAAPPAPAQTLPQGIGVAATQGTASAIRVATEETVEHVGSYVTLMIATQLVGGMVERSEVMNLLPQHFPNVWIAMGFLVLVKVLLGMIMEPLGAIILVSSTLAPMAYRNGIDPVNFWMMVLVAFELGYLLPPVALNQLLTRQVVGEAEIARSDLEVASLSFYRRYERWILPCAVMSISLLLVAFVPLAVQRFSVFAPILRWCS